MVGIRFRMGLAELLSAHSIDSHLRQCYEEIRWFAMGHGNHTVPLGEHGGHGSEFVEFHTRIMCKIKIEFDTQLEQ